MTNHKEYPNFVEVSSVDVDSGSIWIGDPCYVIKDSDEKRPDDLGSDWHGICNRFFERSGHTEDMRNWFKWQSKRENAWMNGPEFEDYINSLKNRGDIANTPEEQKKIVDHLVELRKKASEEFEKANPYVPTPGLDKGFANFTHDGGHGGMGTMTDTYYGDGSYPVYIEYGKNGRPRKVLIDFDPGCEDEED